MARLVVEKTSSCFLVAHLVSNRSLSADLDSLGTDPLAYFEPLLEESVCIKSLSAVCVEVPALAKEVCEEPVEIAKRTRAGVHIINKRGLNAKSKNEPLQFPSHLLHSLPATLTLSVKRSLPLASPVQPLPQRPQRAYGSSEAPLNEYEPVLFEMNGLLPVAALLQIGPYVVPLLVLRFVVDKTGRFLALVTCPWSKSRRVFSLFHFFKNMLHLLHQMDKDARLALLQKFGDSQVLFFLSFFLQNIQKHFAQRSAYNHFFLLLGGVCFKFSETWTHVDVGNLWCGKLPFGVVECVCCQDFVPQTGVRHV